MPKRKAKKLDWGRGKKKGQGAANKKGETKVNVEIGKRDRRVGDVGFCKKRYKIQ
jgi:hypothetical protein